MMRCKLLMLLLIVVITVFMGDLSAADAVLDAKRDAAAKLLKDGKPADAQKLYEEIVAADDKTWSDHYALAKIYDKSGDTPKAVTSYQHVVKLLKNNTRTSAERSALSESQKRVDTLDQVSKKLDEAVEDFLKSIEALAKEAEQSNNAAAVERIQQILLQLGRLTVVKVDAKAGWVATELSVNRGDTIVISAKGTWSVLNGDPKMTCDANGTAEKDLKTGWPLGVLLGRIGEQGEVIQVGKNATIKSNESGVIYLCVSDSFLSNNSGLMEVRLLRR